MVLRWLASIGRPAMPAHNRGRPSSFKEEEMTQQARKRRLQYNLTIAGNSVIAFGVWTLVKIGLFLSLVDDGVLLKVLSTQYAPLIIAIFVALAVMVLIDLAIRAYVGYSARAEGLGKQKSPLYLFVAGISAIASAAFLIVVALIVSFALEPLTIIIPFAIESTAIAALVLVIYSSIGLRRMGKTKG